jgi:putative DNA primase/helicase
MWVRYESGIWRVVTNNEVDLKVSTVLEAAKDAGVKPSTRLRAAVRNYAAPKVSIHADLFNANEDIYVFRNVVFNTAERREYPHSPEFYSTIQLPYDFDANSTCPTWVRVMEALDRRVGYELSAFLQEIMGYTLTSVRTAQRTFWFQGLPGGGKTTFLEGVRAAFGKYTGTLTAKNLDSDFGLMDIPGKRALVCPEVNAKFLESTETLNSLVDGGQYEIQRKFKDALEFYNRAVILWAMNRIPRIDSPENGIFRRALLIKMPAIPLGEQEAWIIPAVRREGAGIFQWALQGLDRYLENGGFTIPEQVNMDTEAWINSNDPIRRFLNEWYTTDTDTDRHEWVPVADLYRHYKVWAASESALPIRKLKFNEDLRERFGLTEYRKEDRWWRGLVMTEYGRAQLDCESDFVHL